MLSFAGRATLVKSVISALPSYTMSAVQLPISLCTKMDQKVRMFWWGHSKPENLCLKSWDSVCTPKSYGSLGFRKMKEANRDLFAKLAWQVTANEDRVWVKQLRTKYCSRRDFFNVEKNVRDSRLWKDLLDCRNSIVKGACYVIGNGRAINIWKDPWVPYVEGFKVWPKDFNVDLPVWVHELIDQQSRRWDQNMLDKCFDDETV